MDRDVTDVYREFGDERLPPGQHRTESFPVLSKGSVPRVERDEWALSVSGAVETPVTLDWDEFQALCVPFATLADHVGVDPDAEQVMFAAADDYTTNVPLEDCLRPGTLFAYEFDGEPLARDHGGPVRVVTPHKYAYKGAKWVTGVEFLTEPERGFWERRGYSVSANPWREERYDG